CENVRDLFVEPLPLRRRPQATLVTIKQLEAGVALEVHQKLTRGRLRYGHRLRRAADRAVLDQRLEGLYLPKVDGSGHRITPGIHYTPFCLRRARAGLF